MTAALTASAHRARTAILAAFLGFGGIIGLFAGAVPAVARLGNIDNQTLGWCFTVFTLAGVTMQGFGSRLGRCFSAKSILLATMPSAFLSLAVLMAARSAFAFAAALIVFGIVMAVLDLYMNGEATKLEDAVQQPLMSGFHGAVSLAIAVFAVISGVLSSAFGPLATIPFAAVILGLTGLAIFRLLPGTAGAQADHHAKSALRIGRRQLVRLAGHGLSFGLVTAAETSAVFWAAKLFADQSPALAVIAGAGIAFFSGCQATSRFAGDRLRKKFGDQQLIVGSIALATAGCAGVGLLDGFTGRAMSLALFGVGVGAIVPIILAAVSREMGEARVKGIGIVAAVSGVPRTFAPWIFGVIAAQSSIAQGFLAAAIGLGIALLIVFALRLQTMQKDEPPLRNAV